MLANLLTLVSGNANIASGFEAFFSGIEKKSYQEALGGEAFGL